MATEVKLTITLEAALAARLSAAATEHGWSAESVAADCIAQSLEVALRHRVLIERMEQIDAAILDMAEAVGELAARRPASTCPGSAATARTPAARIRPDDRLPAPPRRRCRGRLYYTNDSQREARPDRRDEYYLADGGGVWWSSGDSVVRHGAAIDAASFRDLCAGIHPATGKPLVRGAGSGHWAGQDCTLTPGKSVSVLWMAGSPEQRAAIEAAHRSAVERALAFVAAEGLVTVRTGAGGVERHRPSDVIVGRFDHYTTREGDPNIHTHCVFINVAGAPRNYGAGRYKSQTHLTIEVEQLYAYQVAVGAAYRAALAEGLRQRFDLRYREAGRGQWEIAGLPEAVLTAFSKRSEQIRDYAGPAPPAPSARSPRSPPAGARRNCRPARSWRRAGARNSPPARSIRGRPCAIPSATPLSRSRQNARRNATPRSTRPRSPATAGGARCLVPVPARERAGAQGPAPARPGVRRCAGAGGRCRGGGARPTGAGRHAAAAGRRRDGAGRQRMLDEPEHRRLRGSDAARADRPLERTWITHEAVDAALARAGHLSAEQGEAVRHAAGPDGVSLLQAGAGTGKTTTAAALVAAAHDSGLRVVGLAPSWVAADELARSTGIPAQAIARWRHDRARATASDPAPHPAPSPALDRDTWCWSMRPAWCRPAIWRSC